MNKMIIINSKNNEIFALPHVPSVKKKKNFTVPNRQLANVKSVFKSLDYISSK